MEIKPVFIIGSGHSGTSILYRMLATHPDFAWFSQYSCRGGEVPGRFKLPFYKYFNRTLRSFFRHSWAKEENGLKIIPRPGDAEMIWDYIFSQNQAKHIFAKECRNWNKSFILLKNIRFYRYLPPLKDAFPQAKFIHIVRDGRAIVLSRKYKVGVRGEDRRHEPIENFFKKARAWAQAIKMIDEQKRTIDMLELKYEDFCQDVRGHLKKILDYAGLDSARFPFGRFPEKLTSINKKWFEIAETGETAKLNEIQKEMLQKYGYL